MKTIARLSTLLLVTALCISMAIGVSAEKVIPEPDNPIWTSFGATAGGVALVEETPDGEATGDILYVTEGETFDVIASFSAPTSSIGFNLAFHYNPSAEVGVIDYMDGEWLQKGVIPYNITVAQRPPVGGDVYYIANVTFAGFNFYAVQGDVFKLTIKALSPTPANATDYLYLSIEPKFCLSMDSTSDELLLPYNDFGVRIVVLCKEHDLEVDTWDSQNHTLRCKNCPYKAPAEAHNWDNGTLTPGTDCQNPDKTVYACTTCGYSKTSYGTAEHSYTAIEKLNATHHAKKCICGKYITEKHSWNSGEVTSKPACDKPGEKTFTCTQCGETKTEPVPVIDHVYGDWEKLNETQHAKKCACGDTVKENHKWDTGKVTTKPACDKPGEKTFTCSECGQTKTEPVPVIDHVYGDWEKLNETQHVKKCACGDTVKENHKWDAGKVTSKPACNKPGEKTFTCSECGQTKTEPVPVIDHVYGDWEKLNETQHAKKCACGDTVKANHKWDAGKVTTKPACNKPGEKTFTCSDCGQTKTEPVPVTAHTYTNACDPDCNGCGLKREITHNYSSKWTSDKETHFHKCSVCGDKADTSAHTPSDWIIDKEAAPAVAGSKHTECTVCKRTLQTQQIPALECKHEGDTAISGKCDPTCEEDGNTGNTVCAICQTILQPGETIPAIGHDYQLTGQKDATCEENGYTGDDTCQNCQAIRQTGEEIPSTGHSYENGSCTACGEAQPVKPTQPTTPSTTIKPTTQKPTTATTPATTAPAAAEDGQQDGNSGSVVTIVIIVLAALALIGGGIFLLKRKNRA